VALLPLRGALFPLAIADFRFRYCATETLPDAAQPVDDLALVGRVRRRCFEISKPQLCPATSQPACQDRNAWLAAFRRYPVEGPVCGIPVRSRTAIIARRARIRMRGSP